VEVEVEVALIGVVEESPREHRVVCRERSAKYRECDRFLDLSVWCDDEVRAVRERWALW
jgi:hypothetical protein